MDDSKSEFVCSDCGTPVRESAGVCPQCGAKLEWKEEAPEPDQSAEFACADCGASVAQADRVCPHCGADLEWGDNSHVSEYEARPYSPSLAVTPMRLGDIFDRTFTLFGKTFTRSIPIILILLLPVSVLVVEGSREFYNSLSEIASEGETFSRDSEVWFMLRWMGLFGFAIMLSVLVALAAELAVTLLVFSEVTNTPIPWRTALRDAMSVRYLRVLGVALLQIMAVGGIFIAAMTFAVLSTGLVLLAILIAAGFVAFLLIRWSLAFTTVGCENAGVSASFRRSWFLVKDEWWRVFGILALMTILLNFAIALITTPISMIASWDFYKEYFRALGSAGKGQPDPTLTLRAMSSMGLGIGVAASLNLMLQTLVKPVYTTVLFFDLRARKREFDPPPPSLLFDGQVDPAGNLPDGDSNGG